MQPKVRIVILGGGTAGWMTAAALSRLLPGSGYQVTLVSAPQIPAIGVGEATIPHIRHFNSQLGIDENDFIRATGATYKLAIRFRGWGQEESDYCHGFGYSGELINDIEFHHYFLHAFGGQGAVPYDQFCMAALAARAHKFAFPQSEDSLSGRYGYAFHVDATRYAQYLRDYSLKRGVAHVEKEVLSVDTHASGDLAALLLSNGQRLEGDWFIDCSGFRGRLIGQTLNSAYQSWQHWLPCDRAVAAPSPAIDHPPSYTLSQAQGAGWRWQIPLQHRTGNGLVYASEHLSEQQAAAELARAVAGLDESDIRPLRFVPGKRQQAWVKNCIAIGLSGGFLEPLESTSLYLVQKAIEQFIQLIPADLHCEAERRAFNQTLDLEYERIRDFLILHYYQNRRTEAMWRYCATMPLPDSLQSRLEMFQEAGHFSGYRQGLFMPVSWVTVALGQGLLPRHYDSRVSRLNQQQVRNELLEYRQKLCRQVEKMTHHQQAIAQTTARRGDYPRAVNSLYGEESA